MSAPTIVFIHAGDQHWLKQTLTQAHASNPQSRVVLIAQERGELPAGIEFEYLGDYFAQAATLKQSYEHFSQYDPAYELFCFQRWFVLRDFMRRHVLERTVYLDSDVLTFSDLSTVGRPFEACDMTLSRGHCGHNAYVNNLGVLASFCDFCADFLSQPRAKQIDGVLRDATLQSLGLRGEFFPLNDMRVLQLFRESSDSMIGDTAIVLEGVTFDHDMAASQGGFEMEQGVKKLSWREGKPYGRLVGTGREVQFATLHFKGGLKPLLVQTFEEHCRG